MITQQILDKIKEYNQIIIHRHVRPDPDAYGSQNALAEIIKESFPEKKVAVVGEEEEYLHFLAKMDTIPDTIFEDALVIVCDTANQERISDTRYVKGKELIKIDHHPVVDAYGDIQWVDTDASSTSEMIYQFYEDNKEQLVMNNRAAKLIYCGIVGDTGRFLFPSTTNRTFEYAAELVKYSFDRTEMYQEMYKTTIDIARLRGYILQNVHISRKGVSHVKITKALLEEFHLQPNETSAVVGVLGDIEGINVWGIFVEEDDCIRVRLRSKGPVINTVAAKFEGGGHPLAAGAKIYNWDQMEEVLTELENASDEYYG
ncbi:phosphoesterase RecJ-like protein [Gracilibacillus halotolerans]|uniref:Phosphoesterase RecJ-like protein n=1 Tax=Gracilibacillus halotolerans TaxID=74386 RepID=A0A841RRS9_9BACI|nr:bifunctional oligoribonuclease/PAP phosphatase NrnA [Gracilibacillus halotolerans]MBB6513915.1 phosphoesterase RecJ-like protein [Gracilibacillus halotolerans]